MITFHSSDDLVQRLRGGGRPIVFLVGSALTMPISGSPGVCGVAAMIDLIRARIAAPKGDQPADRAAARRALATFDQTLASITDPGARYQQAFDQLAALVDGADAINAVIREAVLKARTAPTTVDLDDPHALAALERSPDGWHLGPAVKALGHIIARHRNRFGRAVLTTNFDPLVELAVRAAGGHAQALEQLGDGSLSAPDPVVTSVVHLHGLWRSDTLQTPGALTVDRPALRSALTSLYQEVTLVVLAYGGWDDILTTALMDLAHDAGTRPDVVWCFYEKDHARLAQRYPKLLALFSKFRQRVACYAGVDCNVVLPQLRAALDGEGELLGRELVCDELYGALDGQHAVEILGEPHMERSRLLAWARRELGAQTQVALISARELATQTPEALVLRIADAVGRRPAVEAEIHREHAVPTAADAVRALKLLRGTSILIDDADALASPGHRFTESFFAELRALVQARQIRWISVSRTPLGPLFQRVGLTSQFLNDSTRVHAGGLTPHIVERALFARLGPRAAAARTLTGTLPRLVYRMCDAEWQDIDQALQTLPAWAEGMCALWWDRDPSEQALLGRAATGVAHADLTTRERTDAAGLIKRGLLIETPTGYALNGKVWEDYVRTRP